jgi:hypothetical protein
MNGCVFCGIVRGELERSVFEGDPFRVHREGGDVETAPRPALDAAAAQLREVW